MKKLALDLYKNGYNCAEALLQASEKHLNNYSQEIRKTATSFGTGMFSGESCGVVSGALIALGLKYAPNDPLNRTEFKILYKKIKAFQQEFKDNFQSLNCSQLKKEYNQNCFEMVEKGAEILEGLLC